jgi:D-apionolactonase
VTERAIKLFGTEEPVPERRVLNAGPLSATLEAGQLRWIKLGDAEVIRGIAFLIRDRNWSTVSPQISNLKIDESGGGFRVTFDALCRTPDGDIPWTADYRGTPDGTITCVGTARPKKDVVTCRTGFVILHPLAGVAGRPMEIEHVDGKKEKGQAPDTIDPQQSFLNVRAMTHEPLPGVRATIRMEGDAWETEDHRNWTDASFKTYCRPLVLPWPYTLKGGVDMRHTVTLSFGGTLPAKGSGAAGAVSVRLGAAAGPMPRVGLSVLPEDAERALAAADLVKQVKPQHLNVRVDLRGEHWQRALPLYRELAEKVGAEVVLEAILPGSAAPKQEVKALADAAKEAGLNPAAVVATPAADLKSYPPGVPLPETASWAELVAAVRAAFPGVRIGGGMLSNFTELNRKRPPQMLFDFITHATSGLVHAADDRSVMETLEAVEHIIRSTRAIGGNAAYRIGPSHIGNSFNPYGASHTENAENRRVTMARVEPRHRGLFGAAWHLGYLSVAAEGGLEAVTMASPAGEFGVAVARLPHAQPWFDTAKDAKVYPLFHVLRGVAGGAGSARIEAQSSDQGRVRALAWRNGGGTQLWLANLRDEPVEVRLEGVRATRVTRLDEGSFAAAAADPAFMDHSRTFAGDHLSLDAFAVARLEIGS